MLRGIWDVNLSWVALGKLECGTLLPKRERGAYQHLDSLCAYQSDIREAQTYFPVVS